MNDSARPDAVIASLLALWDTTAGAVAALDAADWDRPVADGTPGSDVTGLVTHLAGVHYCGPERLPDAIDTARAGAALRLRATLPSPRVLGAQCLDMCLHTHDLTDALGVPLDHDAARPAAVEAAGLLAGLAPRLLIASGVHDATLRLLVRPRPDEAPVVDRTVRLRDGRPVTGPQGIDPAQDRDTVDVTATGLVLMLTGRRDADGLASAGLAGWSGETADRFVRRARLVTT